VKAPPRIDFYLSTGLAAGTHSFVPRKGENARTKLFFAFFSRLDAGGWLFRFPEKMGRETINRSASVKVFSEEISHRAARSFPRSSFPP
jgi:hypothetical protein